MKKTWTYWVSIFITLVGITIFLWFCVRGYWYEGFIDPSGDIALERSAQFGDFIGGCTGAIFALVGVFLLFETLRSQRKEFSESRNVFYKQQFDNTFFGLLDLYKDLVRALVVDQNAGKNGKDFFSFEKDKLSATFRVGGHPVVRKKAADEAYISYYTTHKSKIAHYYRTLYRLFCLVDESKLIEEDKVSYAKILRAQLSESEQFFLYYNACIPYGEKFKYFINKYNLLKHLPKLEKLEFLNYASLLDGKEKQAIEMVLYDLKKKIKISRENVGVDSEYHIKTYLKGKYTFKAFFPSDDRLNIIIYVKENMKYSSLYQQGYGLDKFSPNTLAYLVRDYLIDTIYFNDFYETYQQGSVVFFDPSITTEGISPNSKTIISVGIETKDHTSLKLRL